MRINSHNEWDKLKEIIVGNPEAKAGVMISGVEPLTKEKLEKIEKLRKEAYPQWLIDEISEDLEGLCDVCRKADVKVHRPKKNENAFNIFMTPHFTGAIEHCYNMRDHHLIVGDTVVESPSQEGYRYFEAMGLYDVWYDYFKDGFRWISAPKPRLTPGHKVPFYDNGKKHFKLYEDEILFEAANTVRMGKDLLYLVSRSGNNIGAKWLQSILGEEYRVHTTDKIYKASHIDSTVLALRPGLVLLCANRVNEDNCPKLLKKWDRIYFSDVVPTPSETKEFNEKVRVKVHRELQSMGVESSVEFTSSDWIGLNFLSLNPETVVVDERQIPLIRTLEKNKLTVVPIRFRHSYMMGGIHCSTLDTVRESKLESYFD